MTALEHRTAVVPPPARRAAVLLALFAVAAAAPPCFAEGGSETRRVAAARPDSDEVTGQEQPAPAKPAGMVFVPGGTYPIGIDEKPFREFLEETSFAREMKNTRETGWNEQLSTSTPQYEQFVAPYWIGEFEVTNAQWHAFLRQAGRVEVTIPSDKVEGPRTLTDIAQMHLLVPPFKGAGGKMVHREAVTWDQLYDINEERLNPSTDADGNPIPDAKRLAKEWFRSHALAEGTRVVTFRYSLPTTWKDERFRQQASVPAGTEDHPVTDVSLVDALAFAAYYGCHIPTEVQWEIAARGPEGRIYPEGAFDPLAHAWRGFNTALREAKKGADAAIDKARQALEKEREGGNEKRIEEAKRALDRALWIDTAVLLPDGAVSVPVGSFSTLDTSWCGTHDMVGNVDEWTMNTVFAYTDTKSPSTYFVADAHVLRGGNLFDPDTALHSLFRKFLDHGPIRRHYKFTSGGFRVARYDVPGASGATEAVLALRSARPSILPGEYDRKHQGIYVDLDLGGAVGIEQLHEWQPRSEDDFPPQGKVYYFGPARSVAVVPASGLPVRSDNDLRKAADKAPRNPAKKEDTRLPRDIPFLGIVHLTPGLSVKGLLRGADGTWAKGTLDGADHPRGLLLGWGAYEGDERRPVLWEARTSSLGGAAPGGFVLLEEPLMLLEPDALAIDDISLRDFTPRSAFDATAGTVTLDFAVVFEGTRGKKGAHATLRLTLGDFEPRPEHGPWRTAGPR